jgi:hypothetical protein
MASRVPAALRERLGDNATLGLVELFESERNDWSEHVLSVSVDRFERRLTEEMSGLRLEFHQALNELSSSLRAEMATTRVEMLKWSFLFWVGQVAVMAGLLSFMLRGVR